ncbi:LOW QUALITY PROTEIN: hypothetical protein CRUP_017606 [Coryphaenoides rupestris]|nr:LOW QUALITY PROTEIN: hypothetical protein CRUP_017606 [Coryphaenoides rupestris]
MVDLSRHDQEKRFATAAGDTELFPGLQDPSSRELSVVVPAYNEELRSRGREGVQLQGAVGVDVADVGHVVNVITGGQRSAALGVPAAGQGRDTPTELEAARRWCRWGEAVRVAAAALRGLRAAP